MATKGRKPTVKTVKTAARKPVAAKAQLPSLGEAQVSLEQASREMRSAQKAYRAISDRLAAAEEAHSNAVATLNATLFAVKSDNKVISLQSQ